MPARAAMRVSTRGWPGTRSSPISRIAAATAISRPEARLELPALLREQRRVLAGIQPRSGRLAKTSPSAVDIGASRKRPPRTGAEWCEVERVGLVLSGRAAASMRDGTERVMEPGLSFYVPPGPRQLGGRRRPLRLAAHHGLGGVRPVASSAPPLPAEAGTGGRRRPTAYAAGLMFWLKWKKFVGSYFALRP
jgi:hypothetical protein